MRFTHHIRRKCVTLVSKVLSTESNTIFVLLIGVNYIYIIKENQDQEVFTSAYAFPFRSFIVCSEL